MKKAFTLIELLVVVLIIGILAAVAVPSYRQAVETSRLSEAYIMLSAVKNSSDRYYLAASAYPASFEDLDIEIPLNDCNEGKKICCTKWYCYTFGNFFFRPRGGQAVLFWNA